MQKTRKHVMGFVCAALGAALLMLAVCAIMHRGLPVEWAFVVSPASSPVEKIKAAIVRLTGRRHRLDFEDGTERLIVVERCNSDGVLRRTRSVSFDPNGRKIATVVGGTGVEVAHREDGTLLQVACYLDGRPDVLLFRFDENGIPELFVTFAADGQLNRELRLSTDQAPTKSR